jgi:hypothetical protein
VGVFGFLIGCLGLVAALAVGVLTGRLAPPFSAELKVKASPSQEAVDQPCAPAEGAVYPDPSTIQVRVFNASGRQGYATSAADALADHGFPKPDAANAAPYEGVAKVVAGLSGVLNAYTVLEYLPQGSVIIMDRRDDSSVDLVLGLQFQGLKAFGDVAYEPGGALTPLEGCKEPADIIAKLPPPPETPPPAA